MRIATITTFIHSLLFTIYLLYLIVKYGAERFGEESLVNDLLTQYITLIRLDTGLLIVLVVLGIILAIGYYLLPPIGEAAMIYYLDDNTDKGMESLAKGIYKFFPMFEFNAAVSLFKIDLIGFMILRFSSNEILGNGLVIMLLTMRSLVALFVLIFYPYARMLITLEDEDFFPAMRRSMQLAIANIRITLKFVIVTALLSIRFIFNILLLVGIPLFLIRLGTRLGLDSIPILQRVFVCIVLGLIVMIAYLEGIIEAFFITCRRKVYKHITGGKTEEKNE